jgi:transcription elongation factor GreA
LKGTMEENKVYLTKEGLENLKKEYDVLVNVRRPSVVERLATARGAGDLSENSDYTQAKQDIAFIDGRISELEEVFNRVEIIVEDKKGRTAVDLGCTVIVEVEGKKITYHLVGEYEADPINQKISPSSPLGKALVGRKVGEVVEVEAPVGKITYKVVSIE